MKPLHILLLLPLLLLLACCSAIDARKSYEKARQCMAQGDAPQALACLRAAADATADDSLRAAIYSEMGDLLFDEGLQEQALGAYQNAYRASHVLNDTAAMACQQVNIANIYRTRENDDSCLYYFGLARQLARQLHDSMLVADIQNQMAGYYLWHNDYAQARRLLLPALNPSQADMAGGICFMAADLYRHTGPADSARHYCQLLLREQETGLRQMGHKWLAELLLAEGKTAEAAVHLEQYEQLTDTLMQETDTESLRRISALYDYSLREQQNARLERRIIMAVAVIVVLMVSLLALLLFFSRRRMHYSMKVQQLEHLLADYRRRDDKAADRQQDILADTPICRHIGRLLGDARCQSMTDEDWHILEDTLSKVQPAFLQRLRGFHRFSAHELHVCMLLRLGLSPAAIAQLTARSKQSISSVRSRLFEKVFGQKGTPAQWDEFIRSL